MKIKTKILLSFVLLVVSGLAVFFTFASYRAQALPSSLGLNVTFGYFKLSTDGVNWVTLSSSPVTVNLLDSSTTSSQGSQVSISLPPAGTYKYLGMSITAIYFSMAGEQNRDILPVLKAQSAGQEDFDNMVVPIIPITYSGNGEIKLNMYMPNSNIAGNSYDTYFPASPPIFSFSGGSVDTSKAGVINITVNGVAPNSFIDVGIFSNISKDAAPFAHAMLTNNGNGTATGSAYVPAGNWYVMGIETDTQITKSGPQEGAKGYTVGGAKPWEGGLSPITVSGSQSANVTLSYAFTVTTTMGAGGSGKKPTGTASISFTITGSPSAISLSAPAELMLYAYTSEAENQPGTPPSAFLGSKKIAAGTFSSVSLEAAGLGAGSYLVIAMLDVDGNGPPTAGVDHLGMNGGFSNPTVINLADGQTLNLSNSPIYINLYTGN